MSQTSGVPPRVTELTDSEPEPAAKPEGKEKATGKPKAKAKVNKSEPAAKDPKPKPKAKATSSEVDAAGTASNPGTPPAKSSSNSSKPQPKAKAKATPKATPKAKAKATPKKIAGKDSEALVDVPEADESEHKKPKLEGKYKAFPYKSRNLAAVRKAPDGSQLLQVSLKGATWEQLMPIAEAAAAELEAGESVEDVKLLVQNMTTDLAKKLNL